VVITGRIVMVVDEGRGCTVSVVEAFSGEKCDLRHTYKYKAVGGSWIVQQMEQLSPEGEGMHWWARMEVRPESMVVNGEVDGKVFGVESLEVDGEAEVYDDILHKRYRYMGRLLESK
jgi:hypothetical protein